MARAGRWTGIVAGVLTWGLLLAGCQGQQAPDPVGGAESARSEPAETPTAAQSPKSEEPSGDAILQTSDPNARVSQEAPPGVTANETAGPLETAARPLETPAPAVALALKFVPGEVTTYKITTELQKSVEWKGPPETRPPKFTDGRTGNHVELTFTQQVELVEDDDSAVLEITIKGLKYVGEVVNKVVLEFDSARPEDAGRPLAKLIDESYRVKLSPRGQVRGIWDIEPAWQSVQESLPGQSVAVRLLSEREIRRRHEIAALSALQEDSVRPGQSWSSLRTFSFDELGAKTYERVYTLQDVEYEAPPADSQAGKGAEGGGPGTPAATAKPHDRLAVVEMKAIPSTAQAAEVHGGPTNPFAGTSDNTDSYTGRLVLDLDRGQVRGYVEQMQNEWIIADPRTIQTGRPTAIKMTARRFHRLEQIQ
jgi:hypothetical protein